jgi:predicted naringenin-chalcone synthase
VDLREIPQLMESYPQLIPRISKVVEPLKAYIRRHSHGERGRISVKSIVILIVDLLSKGLDKEDLVRLLHLHLQFVSTLLCSH